jgi:hypothetical protein
MIGSVTRTRAVIPALVLPLALALGACSGDDPEPRFAPPSTTAPSAPETTPVAEVMGPVETFSAWIDARNEALRTGDTSGVEALSAPACQSCQHAIDPIRQVYANGGHFDTKGWVVVASRLKSRSGPAATVSAGIKYLAGETVPAADADPVVYLVERHIVIVKLSRIDGRWLVRFIGYLS